MTTITAPVAAARAAATPAARQRVADMLAQAGMWALAGGVAGLVAIGAGSRAAMRLVAVSSGRIGTGVRPESGATPGSFTVEGTMFLLLAGTFIGAIVGVYVGVVLARWLPARAGRSAVVAALAAVVPGLALVDPSNEDFLLFGPDWFAVAVFAACAAGFGVLLSTLASRRQVPFRRGMRRVLIAVGVPATGLAVAASAAFGIGVAVSTPIIVALIIANLSRRDGRLRWWWGSAVQRAGEGALVALAGIGVVLILSRAARILLA